MRFLAVLGMTLGLLLPATVLAEQVLHRGDGVEPDTVDPQKAQTVDLDHDLFEGLTGLSPRGEVVPGAAERWELSADGLEYTFHLRAQARWSNGDPLVAEDFVAGLRRAVTPATGAAYSQLLSPIRNAAEIAAGRLPPDRLGVEAPDPRTVRILLWQPTLYLPSLLAMPAASPLHRASYARYGDQFARPGNLVSNGAYQLAEWVVHSHVKLVRNPYYWNDAATQIDTVYHEATEDQDAEIKRYRAGELDFTYRIPFNQIGALRGQLAPSEIRVATFLGTSYIAFNCTRPPFKDQPGLRRALSMVIDRDVVATKLLYGLGVPALGWVPPPVASYEAQKPQWASWPNEQRLAEARRLYREAGYSPEHPLELELRYPTRDDYKRLATVVTALWKQRLGVNAHPVNEEFKVFLAHARQRTETQAVMLIWQGDYDDATTFLDTLRSSNGFNYAGWNDARYDALLDTAAAQVDPVLRRSALEQAERRLLEESPLVPIFHVASRHLLKPRVEGWEDNVLDHHYTKDLRVR